MSAVDRRTKAQIIAAYQELEGRLKAQIERERELTAAVPTPPARVPAADALAGCIRALEPLATPSNRSGYSPFDNKPVFSELVGVLQHLLNRYGVNLTERITEPCGRAHLDSATESDLLNQLRGGGYRP